jgi:hypothetical protein
LIANGGAMVLDSTAAWPPLGLMNAGDPEVGTASFMAGITVAFVQRR